MFPVTYQFFHLSKNNGKKKIIIIIIIIIIMKIFLFTFLKTIIPPKISFHENGNLLVASTYCSLNFLDDEFSDEKWKSSKKTNEKIHHNFLFKTTKIKHSENPGNILPNNFSL